MKVKPAITPTPTMHSTARTAVRTALPSLFRPLMDMLVPNDASTNGSASLSVA